MKLLRETIRRLLAEMFGGGARQEMDPDDFKDEVDYKFAQYAINERPLILDDGDKKFAKRVYGGLDGVKDGVIYSGGRIGSEDQLQSLRALQNGGRTNVSMKSYSHNKATARSFADFVMTYDGGAGSMAYAAALQRGSSGEFGSYLITIEADPDTILINTRREDGVTRSVESELIVDGSVTVVNVEIIAPLQKDSWTEQTVEEWDSLKDLDAANFLGVWLEYHKIDPWQGGHLEEYLDEVTSTIDGLVKLLTKYRNSKILELKSKKLYAWLESHPLLEALIDRIELQRERQGIHIFTRIDGQDVYLGEKLKARLVQEKGMDLVGATYQDARRKLINYMEGLTPDGNHTGVDARNSFSIMAFYYVGQYILVLKNMDELGVLEYKHTQPLGLFQDWLEEITEIGITEDNWQEHKLILREVPKISMMKDMMDFLEERADSDLALDTVLQDYLRMIYQEANNYRKINQWQDPEDFLSELPKMLQKAIGAVSG
jgi:hypothetical protein